MRVIDLSISHPAPRRGWLSIGGYALLTLCIISGVATLASLALFVFTYADYRDALPLDPFLWLTVWQGLVTYGLCCRLPWARWAMLLEVIALALQFLGVPFLDGLDAARLWEKPRHFFILTEPIVSQAPYLIVVAGVLICATWLLFRHEVIEACAACTPINNVVPNPLRLFGLLLILIAIGCVLYGSVLGYQTFWSDSCRVTIKSEGYTGFAIPAAILGLVGFGLRRLESWSRIIGTVLIALILPWLTTFLYLSGKGGFPEIHTVMLTGMGLLLCGMVYVQYRPAIIHAYAAQEASRDEAV